MFSLVFSCRAALNNTPWIDCVCNDILRYFQRTPLVTSTPPQKQNCSTSFRESLEVVQKTFRHTPIFKTSSPAFFQDFGIGSGLQSLCSLSVKQLGDGTNRSSDLLFNEETNKELSRSGDTELCHKQ
jgi:hypothetical protein